MVALRAKWEAAQEAGRNLFEEQAAELDRQTAEAREILVGLQARTT